MSSSTTAASHTELDLFRQTHVRYLGYANEVGEAFRAFLSPQTVRASYVVAFAYAAADATHKGLQAYAHPTKNTVPGLQSAGSPAIQATSALVDTAIWQTAASVLIPGFTINRTVALSRFLLSRFTPSLSAGLQKAVSTGVGLAMIPAIIHPIDSFVDEAMDNYYRPFAKDFFASL